MSVCMHAQSYPTLYNPMDCSLPGSSVHEISQARILEWLTFPPPEDLPRPEIKPGLLICCTGSRPLRHLGSYSVNKGPNFPKLLTFSFQYQILKWEENSKCFLHLNWLWCFPEGSWGFPGGAVVKNLPLSHGVQSLGQEGPLEKEMATHSSILAWEIPWTEEPDRLQSRGLQRVGHDWACTHTWKITKSHLENHKYLFCFNLCINLLLSL